MSNFTGLTAVITGASSGLGEAIAKKLAASGCTPVLVSENRDELLRVKGEIEGECAITPYVIDIDLFDTEAPSKIYQLCRKNSFKIDILINCAGIFLHTERELSDIKSIGQILNLHVQAMTQLCFLFGAEMIKNGGGYILNLSSIASQFVDPASLTYGPTKNYILSLSEALHCEWKDKNVAVTCILPGGIRTNFFRANNIYIPPLIRATLMEPEQCADIALRALQKGKMKIIPGFRGKLQYFFLKLVVHPFTYRFIKKKYYSMREKEGTFKK